MYLKRYRYNANENFSVYTFTSEGPKGKIRKVIKFVHMVGNLYNLAFGDIDESTGQTMDTVVTNNNDSLKVLSTIAACVHDFTVKYPNALIFMKGSTHSRTRLYRRAITTNWSLINDDYVVYGQMEDGWEEFVFGEDYVAFLIHRNNL